MKLQYFYPEKWGLHVPTDRPGCVRYLGVHTKDSCHVETICVLGRKKDKDVQYAYVDYAPKDAEYLKGMKGSATYAEIKSWVKDKYGLTVSTLNIAQI